MPINVPVVKPVGIVFEIQYPANNKGGVVLPRHGGGDWYAQTEQGEKLLGLKLEKFGLMKLSGPFCKWNSTSLFGTS